LLETIAVLSTYNWLFAEKHRLQDELQRHQTGVDIFTVKNRLATDSRIVCCAEIHQIRIEASNLLKQSEEKARDVQKSALTGAFALYPATNVFQRGVA
jgi:hypothetical protein